MTQRFNTRHLLFMFILLVNFFSFQAQETNYTYVLDSTTRFDKMGVKEGLSSEYTQCIHQDKFGFIWIGTQFGLNLYDGYHVEQFIANPKNPQSLYNDFIRAIYEEPDGTMWFGTSIGISKYDRATKTFSNYIPDTLNLHGNKNNVQNILADGDDLWIDTWNNLFCFNKKEGVFKPFAKDTLNQAPGSNIEWRYTFIDNDGNIWAVSCDNETTYALNKFNTKKKIFTQFAGNNSNPESFPNYDVLSIIQAKDGTNWIASIGGGLVKIVDEENGIFRRFTHHDNDKNSVISNNLNTVFVDSEGNIWTGGTGGFSLLNKKTGQFTNFQVPNISTNHHLPNIINNISEGKNGNLLITSRDGFFIFNPSTRVLHHYLNDTERKLKFYDANGLTPGIYTYVLTTGNLVENGKMSINR